MVNPRPTPPGFTNGLKRGLFVNYNKSPEGWEPHRNTLKSIRGIRLHPRCALAPQTYHPR